MCRSVFDDLLPVLDSQRCPGLKTFTFDAWGLRRATWCRYAMTIASIVSYSSEVQAWYKLAEQGRKTRRRRHKVGVKLRLSLHFSPGFPACTQQLFIFKLRVCGTRTVS